MTKSKEASKATNAASELEAVHIAVAGSYDNGGNLEISSLLTNLNNEVQEPKTIETAKQDNQDIFPVTVTAKYGRYEIDDKGKVDKISGIFLDKTSISLSDEKLADTLTAILTSDLSGTIEWSLENGTIDGDTSSNNVASITPLTGNSITVTKVGVGGSTTITATLAGTEYSKTCIVKIISPTDIYVTFDVDTLRFYRQKDNVSGSLYKDNKGQPINFKNNSFTTSSAVPWGGGTGINNVSFEEEISPTSTALWFYNLSNLTDIQHMERLNTNLVTNMNGMFRGCSSLKNIDVSNFDTSNVTSFRTMFYECKKLWELDLSNWDTSKVTTTEAMFRDCNKLITVYVGDSWNMDNVTNSEYMFLWCYILEGEKGTRYEEEYKDKTRAKVDKGESDPGYFVHISNKGKLPPRIDEYIVLGNAIDGVNGDSNEDDWKILCYDRENENVYAILDNYLKVTSLPDGLDFDTDENNQYAVFRTSRTNKPAEERNLFIQKLTDKDKWNNLISNGNSSIRVFGALPREKTNGFEDYENWDYISNLIVKGFNGNYSLPPVVTGINGYWTASPNHNAVWDMWTIAEYKHNGTTTCNSVGFGTKSIGVRPVVIVPFSIVEKNENGIWEVK